MSFDVESPGGYLRTVTGTIAYLDAEAETYMVLASDGDLIRVPLRDIKRTIESVAGRGHGHGSRPSRVLRSETMPYGPDPIARHESEVVT